MWSEYSNTRSHISWMMKSQSLMERLVMWWAPQASYTAIHNKCSQADLHTTLLIAPMPTKVLEQISTFKQTDGFLIRQFVLVCCAGCERLTELWTVSACEHLVCIIKTSLTKYNWSGIFRKNQSICFTVFLTHIIGRMIVQSELKMNFWAVQH